MRPWPYAVAWAASIGAAVAYQEAATQGRVKFRAVVDWARRVRAAAAGLTVRGVVEKVTRPAPAPEEAAPVAPPAPQDTPTEVELCRDIPTGLIVFASAVRVCQAFPDQVATTRDLLEALSRDPECPPDLLAAVAKGAQPESQLGTYLSTRGWQSRAAVRTPTGTKVYRHAEDGRKALDERVPWTVVERRTPLNTP